MNQNETPVIDKLTPVGFRVLLNTYKKSNETKSGLLLPESENSGMPVFAKIVVTGKKTFKEKLMVFFGMKPKYEVGQWVYFRKYSVDELKIATADEDVQLFVLEEDEIIGIVN